MGAFVSPKLLLPSKRVHAQFHFDFSEAEIAMQISRRTLMRSAAAAGAATVLPQISAAQGAAAPRMPLSKFLKSDRMVKALRKGVAAMKARPAYDPFSWFYQAAIHGVLPAAVDAERATLAAVNEAEAAKLDGVFQKRYWNQCPHNGEESANFLPWHRGYTYYFERILRLHTEDDQFSLPYWDYEAKTNRKFPKEFGEPFVGGDRNERNPLFMAQRDFYFTRYDHPFAVGLPLLELTDEAVDSSGTLASPVFFGDKETEGIGGGYADEDATTRGLMESRPHDHIHRAVGGIIIQADGSPALGAMSQPPTAGFDPIFPMHHSNIDRLWAVWSCMPGKQWGKLPPADWFNERAWFFWDVGANNLPVRVNEPRRKYFDHRALGVRFEDEDPNCTPLQLPENVSLLAEAPIRRRQARLLTEQPMEISFLPAARTMIPFGQDLKGRLATTRSPLAPTAPDSAPSLLVRLTNLDLGFVPATGFDVHVTTNADLPLRRDSRSFVGSVALFRHQRPPLGSMGQHGHVTAAAHSPGDTFDISNAVASLSDAEISDLKIVVVPYPLLAVPGKETIHLPATELQIRATGIQLLVAE